jgi:hypothetical protein
MEQTSKPRNHAPMLKDFYFLNSKNTLNLQLFGWVGI